MAITGFFRGGRRELNFYQMIQAASAAGDIAFCLDAAAIDSYDPADDDQLWMDLAGGSNHFWRGTDNSSEGSDPTFNGTAGGLSQNEYWGFDGGDFFTGTSNHSFPNNWHKNNAVFSLCGVVYVPALGDTIFKSARVFQSGSPGSGMGANPQSVWVNVTHVDFTPNRFEVSLNIKNGTASSSPTTITHQFPDDQPGDQYVFFAIAIDESIGSNGATMQIDANRAKYDSTYSSPSSSDPVGAPQIGRVFRWTASALVTDQSESGVRIAALAGWDGRRLTDGEIDGIYAQLRARYPTLP